MYRISLFVISNISIQSCFSDVSTIHFQRRIYIYRIYGFQYAYSLFVVPNISIQRIQAETNLVCVWDIFPFAEIAWHAIIATKYLEAHILQGNTLPFKIPN